MKIIHGIMIKKKITKKTHDERRHLYGHEYYDEQYEQVFYDTNIGQK